MECSFTVVYRHKWRILKSIAELVFEPTTRHGSKINYKTRDYITIRSMITNLGKTSKKREKNNS